MYIHTFVCMYVSYFDFFMSLNALCPLSNPLSSLWRLLSFSFYHSHFMTTAYNVFNAVVHNGLAGASLFFLILILKLFYRQSLDFAPYLTAFYYFKHFWAFHKYPAAIRSQSFTLLSLLPTTAPFSALRQVILLINWQCVAQFILFV